MAKHPHRDETPDSDHGIRAATKPEDVTPSPLNLENLQEQVNTQSEHANAMGTDIINITNQVEALTARVKALETKIGSAPVVPAKTIIHGIPG